MHISKVGRGKRVATVEEVLNLGDLVEVRVDDIDVQGKVSLAYADIAPGEGVLESDRGPRPDRGDRDRGDRDRGGDRGRSGDRGADRGGRGGDRSDRPERSNAERATRIERPASSAPSGSFAAEFDAQIAVELGDLGPTPVAVDVRPEEARSGGPRRRRR